MKLFNEVNINESVAKVEVHHHGKVGFGVTTRDASGKSIETHHFDKHEDALSKAKQYGKDVHDMTEEVELDEAIKLGSKVKMHNPGKDYHDQIGIVGEIRHGLYKGAPKTYTVDYGNGRSVQLDKRSVKLHKEDVEKYGEEGDCPVDGELTEKKTFGSTPRTKDRDRIRMRDLRDRLIAGTITPDQKKFLQHVTKGALSPTHKEEVNLDEGHTYEALTRAGKPSPVTGHQVVGVTRHDNGLKGANILKHRNGGYFASGGSHTSFKKNAKIYDTPEKAAAAYHKELQEDQQLADCTTIDEAVHSPYHGASIALRNMSLDPKHSDRDRATYSTHADMLRSKDPKDHEASAKLAQRYDTAVRDEISTAVHHNSSKVNSAKYHKMAGWTRLKEENQPTKDTIMTTNMEMYLNAIAGNADFASTLAEKTLTPAEKKKREEIAQAMERENPGMDMGKKMAIATAQAKKVAEETEQIDELSQDTIKSYVKKVADDAMKHPMNPTKRPAEKASKSVTGFAKALSRLPPEKFFNKEEVELEEGKMDKMSLTQLWHAHAGHDYLADQGYGNGTGSMKHNQKAADAIKSHVAKKYGKDVADDMQSHSEHSTYEAEYAGPKESQQAKAAMQKLRAKHNIGSMSEEVDLDEQAKWRQQTNRPTGPGLGKTFVKTVTDYGDRTMKEPIGREGLDADSEPITKRDPLEARDVAKKSQRGKDLLPKNAQRNLKGFIKRAQGTHGKSNLPEGVEIVDRDSDLDQEHFKLHVNGKSVHFVHHNYENGHATDSKEDIHYQVKQQLKNLSPEHQKAVTNAVHASYRIKEEIELDEGVEIEESKTLGSTPKTKERDRMRMKELMMRLIKGEITKDQKQYLQHVTKGALSPAHREVRMEEVEQIDEISKNLATKAKDAMNASALKHNIDAHSKISTAKDIGSIIGLGKIGAKIGQTLAKDDLAKSEKRSRGAELADRKLGGFGTPKYDSEGNFRSPGPAKILATEEVELEESATPSGLKIYHKEKGTGKESWTIVFTSKDAARREKELKQAGHTVTGRALMFGKKEGKLHAVTEELDLSSLSEAMISYGDFMDKIAMHRKMGNKVVDDKYTDKHATYTSINPEGEARKVTHTPTGTKHENLGNMKGDDEKAEVKQTEKRGRGRPKGTKSGARH